MTRFEQFMVAIWITVGNLFVYQACSPAPVFATAQKIADPLLRAIGFCRSHPEAGASAEEAFLLYKAGDRMGALLRTALAVEQIRARGVPIPDSVETDMVRGMAAAASVEQGLRALSCRNPDGSEKTGCVK